MGLLLGTPYCYQTAVLRLASSNLVFFNRWFFLSHLFGEVRGRSEVRRLLHTSTSHDDELNRQSSTTSTTSTRDVHPFRLLAYDMHHSHAYEMVADNPG